MSDCKVIAAVNQTGGVGKTNLSTNLGIGLAQGGHKVLIVDLDSQASQTVSLGWTQPDELPVTIATMLNKVMECQVRRNAEPIDPQEGILHHSEGVDLMPSGIELSGLELRMINAYRRESLLKSYLKEVKPNYDYAVLDCPPTLGVMTVNALAAADSIIVPVQPEFLSVVGMTQLFDTVAKFYDSKRFWWHMARTSDKLCKEYRMSVIDNPVIGKRKGYTEIMAEREGKPTWRTILKPAIDEIIKMSMTESQFLKNLTAQGWKYKTGKHFAVCPPGTDGFHRLETKLGVNYSLAGINKMINAQERPVFPPKDPPRQVKYYRLAGSYKAAKKLTGFRALYVHYLFLLGKIPKNNPRKQNPNRIFYIYREDIRKLSKYTNEIKLLTRNKIDTSEQLFSYKETLTAELKPLIEQRKSLYNKLRRLMGEDMRIAVKTDISAVSAKIRKLRKEVGLCDDIAVHTQEMKDKMAKERQCKNELGKEKLAHEPIR